MWNGSLMTIIRNILINIGVAAAVLMLGTAVVSYASRRHARISRVEILDVAEARRSVEIECDVEFARTIRPSDLTEAIHSSANYLARAVQEDGKFVYRVNLDPTVRLNSRYNMLRHAGTIYALAAYQQRHPHAEVLASLVKAAEYLKRTAIAEVPGHPELLAVWSKPEIAGGADPLQAKLGGAGLALVALLSLEEVRPTSTSIDELRRLGKFLLYMQKPDGGFYSKYIPSKGGRTDRWTSLYYPGEAALGLLMLYERDRSDEWLQAAAQGLAYLARRREGRVSVAADHWALLATARMIALDDESLMQHPREMFIRHGIQICESILSEKPLFSRREPGCGGFAVDGRTCPTATRLEGLVAALSFVPESEQDLRQRMTLAIEQGLAFLYRAQVREGEHVGGMPRAITRLPASHPLSNHQFNRRATEIRIDYVQHAMSAMLDFQEYSKQIDHHGESELNTK
jgi:hypothetical protein